MVIDKNERHTFVIEMLFLSDTNIVEKEKQKTEKYRDLIQQLSYDGWNIIFIPIIIGVMEPIQSNILQQLKVIKCINNSLQILTHETQKYVILGTLCTLRIHETNHPRSVG